MDIIGTYLQLAPEFGGTEFGPYEDLEVSLGADHTSCHIHIPADFGTFPIHAKLIRQSSTDIILTPSDQAAEVFLFRDGSRRPEIIQGPTKLKNKDSFSLVTAQGPRFILILKELPPDIIKKREEARSFAVTGRKRLSAKSLKTEAKRQLWTQILVFGPMQMFQRAMTFIKSGAIYQPRNIFMAITLLSGYLFALGSCRSNRRLESTVQVTTTKYESCKRDLDHAENLGKDGDLNDFHSIISALWGTGSTTLARSLKEDRELTNLVKKEARALFALSGEKWLLEGEGDYAKDFKNWASAVYQLTDDDMDLMTKKLILWAPMYKPRASDYSVFSNSTGEKTCGLGMLNFTYRQSIHFGLDVQPDALYTGDVNKMEEQSQMQDHMEQFLKSQGIAIDNDEESFFSEDDSFMIDDVKPGGPYCIRKEGTDIRLQNRNLLKSLSRRIGPNNPNLPPPETDNAVISRIATLYIGDLPEMDYTKRSKPFDFERNSVGTLLDREDAEGKWALQKTADVIARSLVLPCLVALDGNEKVQKDYFGEEELPSAVVCFALNWRLNKE